MREPLTRPPWGMLALLAAVKIGGTMAVADRYGWHRDEFYYLASSQHLAFGYVDYPPVTPLLARVDQLIFPGSLPGLRLLTVLAGAAVIVIAALIARELGGDALAQAFAGLAVLISPEFVGTNILFQTVSFDQIVWALICLLFVRLLLGGDPRQWLLLGLVFGIGLETKYTVIGLGVGILVGLLVTRQRRMLASRWPWLGFAIAMVVLLPNLAWQATHHWDSIAYTLNHRGATDGPILYWVEQLFLAGPQLVPLIVIGVVSLWRSEELRPAAAMVIAVELVFFLAGGKFYYPAPIYALAYAAGAIGFADAVRRAWLRRALLTVAIFVTVILLPLGIPVLPAQAMVNAGLWKVRKDYADMIGWPELSQQVTQVYAQVPPSDRKSTVILTNNYGEAGALDYYGRGLPPVVSAELTFYYWAPPHVAPTTLIVVGYPREYLRTLFTDVRLASTVTNSFGIHNDEYGEPIWLCRNPLRPLSDVWSQLKSLD